MNEDQAQSFLKLHESLEALAAEYPRCAMAIELSFFADLTVGEIAEELGVGTATVGRDLKFAKAWLRRAIGAKGEHALWERS